MKFLKKPREASLFDDPDLAKRLEAINARGRVEAAIHNRRLGKSSPE